MRQTRRHHHALLAATVAAPPLSATRLQAQTTTHQIAMLDLAPNVRRLRMVFALPVLRVQPGDTMRLIATARVHNAQSLDGMTPEGAEPFCGRINEEIELTLTVDGT